MSNICKGCGELIADGDEVVMVGKWPFHAACFQALMTEEESTPDPIEDPPPPPPPLSMFEWQVETSDESQPDEVPVGTSTPESQKRAICQVCDEPIFGVAKTLGSLAFCVECFEGLTLSPDAAPVGPDLDTPLPKPEGRARLPDPLPTGLAGTPVSRMGGTAPVGSWGRKHCVSCNRRVMEPGGYHMVDGEPVCPMCFPQFKKNEPPVQQPVQSKGGNKTSGKSEEACRSCGKVVASDAYVEREGFKICEACWNADPVLALEVARKEQRLRMQGRLAKLDSLLDS